MSTEKTDRPLTNRPQIERRLRAACEKVDEVYPGYGEQLFEVAFSAIGLVVKHSYEPIDVNKQLQDNLARAGDYAHTQAAKAQGDLG